MEEYGILDEIIIEKDENVDIHVILKSLRKSNLIKDNARQGKLKGCHCDKCNDKGIIYYPDGEYGIKAAECPCMKTRAEAESIASSGLAELTGSKTFGSFTTAEPWQAKMKNAALAYLREGAGRFFFAGGQSGSGKTHICTALCGEFMKTGHAVRYIRWNDTFQDILRLSENKYRELRERKLRAIERAEILFIDDFFKSAKPSEAEKSLAFNIIESRYVNSKPTIITSDRTLGEINEIREDIAGRIYEKTGDEFLIKIGKDINKNYRFRSRKSPA